MISAPEAVTGKQVLCSPPGPATPQSTQPAPGPASLAACIRDNSRVWRQLRVGGSRAPGQQLGIQARGWGGTQDTTPTSHSEMRVGSSMGTGDPCVQLPCYNRDTETQAWDSSRASPSSPRAGKNRDSCPSLCPLASQCQLTAKGEAAGLTGALRSLEAPRSALLLSAAPGHSHLPSCGCSFQSLQPQASAGAHGWTQPREGGAGSFPGQSPGFPHSRKASGGS